MEGLIVIGIILAISYIWSAIDRKLNPKNYRTPPVKTYDNHLSGRQKSVKALGSSLVSKTGYKRKAKDILVEEYGFSEKTAKYAVGYGGYNDY